MKYVQHKVGNFGTKTWINMQIHKAQTSGAGIFSSKQDEPKKSWKK